MTMRVAMLAAECEPWAKTGGLADVVDALARALGRLPEAGTELDTPVDVFLPRYRSVPVPAAAVTEPALSIPDPDLGRRARRSTSRSWTSPPTATGSAWWTSPPRSTATRSTTTPTTRGGSRSSAAPRSPPCAGTAGPSTSLNVHDWHTGPALLERARADAAGDPFLARTAVVATLHNLAYHGWTGNDRDRPAGPARRRAARGRQPRRHRPPADRDRALRDRQHRVARVRRARRSRPSSAWASTARCAPRATGSSGSSTASTRTCGTRPTTRRSRRRTRARPRRARRPAAATC